MFILPRAVSADGGARCELQPAAARRGPAAQRHTGTGWLGSERQPEKGSDGSADDSDDAPASVDTEVDTETDSKAEARRTPSTATVAHPRPNPRPNTRPSAQLSRSESAVRAEGASGRSSAPATDWRTVRDQLKQVFVAFPVFRTPLPDGGVSFSFANAPDAPTPMEVDPSPPTFSASDFVYQIMQMNATQLEQQFMQQQQQLQLQQLRDQERLQFLQHQMQHQQMQMVQQQLQRHLEEQQFIQMQQQQQQHIEEQQLIQMQQQQQQMQEHPWLLQPTMTEQPPPPPQDRVVFTEWTLVLHYKASQRLVERPIGRIEYAPLTPEPGPAPPARDSAPAAPAPETTPSRRSPPPCCPWPSAPSASEGDIVDEDYDVF
ncbi:transcription activator MSS11-like [Thrips palmi]|uniref:Transcription activator MSS11-like n=1 Tax=Thrips palmi TaxID=161013 RepID=A0A6P8ZLL1_THRPL|nr:transcription activator MSS11-like [Thrips palmi]